MSAYEIYGAAGMALLVLFVVGAAVPVAWSAVHVARWLVDTFARFPYRPARHGLVHSDDYCCGCEDGQCWWCAAREGVR